jgi:hypothetical protein
VELLCRREGRRQNHTRTEKGIQLSRTKTIILMERVREAIELIKIIKQELCRVMNTRAIHRAFTYYEQLITDTTNTPQWQPYYIQTIHIHTAQTK